MLIGQGILLSSVLKDFVIVGEHKLNVDWKRNRETGVFTVTHSSGPSDLTILFRIASKHGRKITLSGKKIHPEEEVFRGVKISRVDVSLASGDTATVRVER